MNDIIKHLNYELFRESGIMPNPDEISVVKNVDTGIINHLYLDHPEDLFVPSYMTGDRSWNILCRVNKILESEEMQCRIHDTAAITCASPGLVSNAFRRLVTRFEEGYYGSEKM